MSIKCRPNFDTKLRHPQCRSPVEISTKLWPNFDSTLRCRSLVKLWICVGQNCGYLLVRIMNIFWSRLWILFGQSYGHVLFRIVYVVWSKLWILFDQNCEYLFVKVVDIILNNIILNNLTITQNSDRWSKLWLSQNMYYFEILGIKMVIVMITI